MVDKSELAIATSFSKSHSFLIELLFNLSSQIITVSTIKLTCHPVRASLHIQDHQFSFLYRPLLAYVSVPLLFCRDNVVQSRKFKKIKLRW